MSYLGSIARRLCLMLVAAVMLGAPATAATIIRDADIENALSELARPVLAAAGLSKDRVKILVTRDDRLNAFVVDPTAIYLHSGLILRMKTPQMLQSVIAHEAAHIAHGHITRRFDHARTANNVTGLGIALAAAVAASGNGTAAGGIGLGVASSASRVFMSHTRSEESAADSSGLRYMTRAGIDPRGYAEVLEIFRGQELLLETRQDPYARTHPLSRDRLRAVDALIAAAPTAPATDPATLYWFARAQGKLSAFLRAPNWTLKRTGQKLSDNDVTLLQQAVAFHRLPNPKKALQAIDALAAMRPNDAFIHDLRGQIHLESRQTATAVRAYSRAAALAPKHPLILAGQGRALLVAGQPKQALKILENARARDFRDPSILRDMATAYAQTGQIGMASLASAERYALLGDMGSALTQANRAAGLLSRGSPPWLRAQDVISAAETASRKRR